MANQIQFEFPGHTDSTDARDRGIKIVLDNNLSWHDKAMIELGRLAGTGRRMTGEQIKTWLLERMLIEPEHVNAWGALIRSACLKGLLRDTHTVTQTETKRSHARRTPVWEFV